MTAPVRGPYRHAPGSVNDPIEQARARGWTAERTADTYGVDFGLVLDIWEAMDDAVDGVPPRRMAVVVNPPTPGVKPCGTAAAYHRHWKRNELCQPCLDAHNLAGAESRARRADTRNAARRAEWAAVTPEQRKEINDRRRRQRAAAPVDPAVAEARRVRRNAWRAERKAAGTLPPPTPESRERSNAYRRAKRAARKEPS